MSETSDRTLRLPRLRLPRWRKTSASPSPNPTNRKTPEVTSEGRSRPSTPTRDETSSLVDFSTTTLPSRSPDAIPDTTAATTLPSASEPESSSSRNSTAIPDNILVVNRADIPNMVYGDDIHPGQWADVGEDRRSSTAQDHLIPENEEHTSTLATQSSPGSELWDQALEKLKSDDRALVEEYEKVLKRASGVADSATVNEEMQAIINSQIQKMESRQWRIRIGRIDVNLRDQMDRIIKVVLAVKDVGDRVAALDPVHAGLPWAGVCVLLSFVVNDSVAKATARAGLEKLTVIVPRYKQVERLYLCQSDESEVSIQLRDAIVKLYASILSYQIEVARHLMCPFFQTFATAALNLDDWTAKLAKIQEADQQCKDFMANCDANLIANATASLHDRLTQLDDRINQRIADILTSHNTVGWNPGPNTDPGYVAVLYGGFQARAGFYRISLAQVDSDRTLFVMLRRGYEKRQHPIRVQLGWLNWFSVTRLEFVKYRTRNPSKASYAHTGETPLPQLLPMEKRIHAWHHPYELDQDENECLKELNDVLHSPEQWGILIVEELDVVKFSIHITITVGISFLVLAISQDVGRTTVASLHSSFTALFILVAGFGVYFHSAFIDVGREVLGKRRMYFLLVCLIVAALEAALESMMSTMQRKTVWGILIVVFLMGIFYGQ